MQNRYVGDLGDFGKYGLLRALCSPKQDDRQALSLGVAWYLTYPTPAEERKGDGGHVQYLKASGQERERYRECDPCLYDGLSDIVQIGMRHVSSIRERGILPWNTVYCEEPLTFEGITGPGSGLQERRIARREEWRQGALNLTSECDVVFVDPDNGLEVKSISRTAEKGPKYAFFDELSPYTQRDQSLVIYQHIARSGNAKDQIRYRLNQIEERLGQPATALWYRRGTSRVFFIVPTDRHRETLRLRAEQFQRGWKEHFPEEVVAGRLMTRTGAGFRRPPG